MRSPGRDRTQGRLPRPGLLLVDRYADPMTTRYSAELLVPAEPAAVWAVLTDPARHPSIDASESVVGPVTTRRLAVGQVFTMRMQYDDGSTVTRYQTDNHVVICETGQAIAWATAVVGEPPLGWTWRYDLTPTIDGTLVRLTYDWTDAPQANVEAYAVPNTDAAGLLASLERLRTVVAEP